MTLNEYQEQAQKFAIYEKPIIYPAVGLIGECGEADDKLKKVIRDSNGEATEYDKKHIALEFGDIMWYCQALLHDLGFQFGEIEPIVKIINKVSIVDYYKNDVYTLGILLGVHCATASIKAVQTHDKCGVLYHVSHVVAIIAAMSYKYGYSLADICNINLDKLSSRKERDKINGSGDDR